MRAILTAAMPEFTRPMNSSISFGLFPAACILVGQSIRIAIEPSLAQPHAFSHIARKAARRNSRPYDTWLALLNSAIEAIRHLLTTITLLPICQKDTGTDSRLIVVAVIQCFALAGKPLDIASQISIKWKAPVQLGGSAIVPEIDVAPHEQ